MMPTTASLNASVSKGSVETVTAQYLTFICADEEYGVEILRVQEIRGWSAVTHMPESPPDVMGVMNLRGAIIPVVDLRVRFSLEHRLVDASTVVIVLRVQNELGATIVGVCVDGVSDVHNVAANVVMETPDVGGRTDGGCVTGLVTLDGKTVMLLNIDRLFGSVGATERQIDA
ncbi:MAG: chemotaxis protein CheW [Steroidobacteraceae bacterium]